MTGDAFAAIGQVMQAYFDGLYFGDPERLARVFHPEARYTTAAGGAWLAYAMSEYFAVVAAREPPARRGEARHDRILGIDFAGPTAAVVRAQCRIGEKFFTDLLSFVLVDGRWQIVAKVFDYERREAAP